MELTFDELVKKGDDYTTSGKPRDAIKMYKTAIKNSKSAEQVQGVHHRLFLAYMERIKDLTEKNMHVEAAALQGQAMEYQLSPALLDRRTMPLVLELCHIRKAFEYGEQYVTHKGEDPQVGILLADRLITEDAWELLDEKKDPFLFFRDAPIVRACIPLMDKGQWQQAAEGMKALPRTSFFAHIRMFCRAMALFGSGDDKNMHKAISLIPQVSVFRKITDVLGTSVQCVEGKTRIQGDKALVACLWEGPVGIWETVEKIIEKEDRKQFDNTMKQLISTFAKWILPDDPEYATQYLLETLWHQGISGEKAFMAFEKALLPRKTALLDARRRIVYLNGPLANAADYLDQLKKMGSDPHTLATVESVILSYVCRAAASGGDRADLLWVSGKDAKRFGISPDKEFDTLWMQCAARGIQCDAGNRALYELAARMNVSSRASKKIKEQLMLSMCEVYPDDPYPCIELASLYHGKNAFRKAENILKKAMELAPYDSRVQDMHVISLVISADKSLNRGNYQLVRQDLEKARSIDTGTNALLLQEKELFYQICEKPEIPEKVIGLRLDNCSLFERLKLASMLRMDVQNKPKKNHPKILRKIDAFFKSELKHLSRLTSEELLAILTPFPREWQYVFESLEIHQLFFTAMDNVLNPLSDKDLIRFVDRILSSDNFSIFQRELQRRTRKRKKDPDHDLLRFYALTLQGLEDDDWDVDGFMDLVEDADPEMEKKFRAAGDRLSRHAGGPYRHALQSLDFEFLEDFIMGGMFDDEDDDEYYDDEDDGELNPFDLFPGGMPEVDDLKDPLMRAFFSDMAKEIKRENPRMFRELFNELKIALESIVDEEGLRGAPVLILNKFKDTLRERDRELHGSIAMLNFVFSAEAKKQLSREAKTLFLF